MNAWLHLKWGGDRDSTPMYVWYLTLLTPCDQVGIVMRGKWPAPNRVFKYWWWSNDVLIWNKSILESKHSCTSWAPGYLSWICSRIQSILVSNADLSAKGEVFGLYMLPTTMNFLGVTSILTNTDSNTPGSKILMSGRRVQVRSKSHQSATPPPAFLFLPLGSLWLKKIGW